MKSSVLKKFAVAVIAIIVILTVTMVAVPASVLYTTPQYDSSASIAGSWTSDPVHSIKSSYNQIYGGDVGVYYFVTNVGLSNAFKRSTSRKAYCDLMEKDDSGSDVKVRSYQCTFAEKNNVYRPYTVSNTYTNSGQIEADNQAELYLDFKVATVLGDTSKNVPKGLLRYQFWSN